MPRGKILSQWFAKASDLLDTRVPLLIKAPGYEPGRSDSFAELLDLYPTLVELCGFDLPDHLQGTSLVRNLEDPPMNTRDAAYSLYPHNRTDLEKLVIGYAVKTERYRYIRWMNMSEATVEAEEMYDHSTDPGENINIAGYARYKEEKTELAALLCTRWRMDNSVMKK